MTAYGTLSPTGLYPGDSLAIFNAESVTAPVAGKAIAIGRPYNSGGPPVVGMEVLFGGAPGTFQVDLQEADTDVDAAYQSVGSVIAVNAGQYARFDAQITGQFARPKVISLQNAVTVTIRLSVRG